MFERYTERARRALFFARYEASQLGGSLIESEHMLLGLLHEGGSLAARILNQAGMVLDGLRAEVGKTTAGQPRVATQVEMPLSAACKAALQRAADESLAAKAPRIGTEHLLLGLLQEADSLAARLLGASGITLGTVRGAIADRPAPPAREPHVVLVQVTIRPEMRARFEEALLHNARESVRLDPGCLRFDVSQDKDDPAKWVLYEVYDSPDAHALHRRSPHFLTYDAVASEAVMEKTVAKCAGRHLT